MELFLEAVIGAIVWTLANVIYVDLRRKGVKRGRIISFFVGWPGTFFTLLSVPEGVNPSFDPPPDDEERLLREIRVDRELRVGGAGERVPGQIGEEGPEAPPRV